MHTQFGMTQTPPDNECSADGAVSSTSKSGTQKTSRKPHACSECYRLKKTCKYDAYMKMPSIRSCDRCLRLKKECVPRVVLRGKRKKNEVETAMDDSEDFEELDAMDNLHIYAQSENLTASFKSSLWWVKAYRSLGLTTPPLSMVYWISHLYYLAKAVRSITRLHSATSLSMATGVSIELQWLTDKEQSLTDSQVLPLQEHVHRIHDQPNQFYFIIRHNAGFRSVHANPGFEALFETTDSLRLNSLGPNDNPHIYAWQKFLMNVRDAKVFMAKVVMTALKTNSLTEAPIPHVWWSYTGKSFVNIKDRFGNAYRARLREDGYMAYTGYLCFFVFSFVDVQPTTEPGRNALRAAYQANYAVSTSSGAENGEEGMMQDEGGTREHILPVIPLEVCEVQSAVTDDDKMGESESDTMSGYGTPTDMIDPDDAKLWSNMSWMLTEMGDEESKKWDL